MNKIFIGTSGWSYAHWKGIFYPKGLPAKGQFDFYTQHFDSVEINRSFYRLLTTQTCTQWNVSTGPEFTFAFKGSRYITHMKKLKDCSKALKRFFAPLRALQKKIPVIVFQLPPHWGLDLKRFSTFLNGLPKPYRYAFEFREPSWYNEAAYALLKKHRAAFCIYELAGHQSPVVVTSDFVYVRLHGPTDQKYQGLYGKKRLGAWADLIKRWKKKGLDVYFYFDNDQRAYAARDALTLKQLLDPIRTRRLITGS